MDEVERIAAFSDGQQGGNPAGVVITDTALDEARMRAVAAEVGYSETAFAVPIDGKRSRWRVRYFSPESEVPFCGHATIALGAALARRHGAGRFELSLNEGTISVEGSVDGGVDGGVGRAVLSSLATRSAPARRSLVDAATALFGLDTADLSDALPPAEAHAGADHLILTLDDRADLTAMRYDLDAGRELMHAHDLVTIMLVWIEHERLFHARNAFASGGVLEDPATGAAAAAFAGYLRDRDWPHGGGFRIVQGEDMGARSVIDVALGEVAGEPVTVSGSTRAL